jgi:hypothetical protein
MVLARVRKRGFLVERRAGIAAVELGRGPGPLIQLDPFAGLTANRAPSEITVTFTSRQDDETITLIRHARPALAPSIGALTQLVGFSTKRCLLVAAVSSASLFLPRLLPAKIAAVAVSAVAMRAYAEDGFTRLAASWTKQDLRHVLDDKPPLRFGDDAEDSLSKPARDQKTSFSDAQRQPMAANGSSFSYSPALRSIMVEEKSQSELTRLRKEQTKARHDEVFGGLSPAELAEYNGKQSGFTNCKATFRQARSLERVYSLQRQSRAASGSSNFLCLLIDGSFHSSQGHTVRDRRSASRQDTLNTVWHRK